MKSLCLAIFALITITYGCNRNRSAMTPLDKELEQYLHICDSLFNNTDEITEEYRTYIKKADKAAKGTDNQTLLGEYCFQKAQYEYFQQKNKECLQYMTKSFGYYSRTGNMEKAASACLIIGEIYNEMYILDSAGYYLNKGIGLLDEKDRKQDSIKGRLLTDLGGTYFMKGDMREAVKTYKNAIEITERNGDTEANLVNCSSIGVAFRRINMPDSAIYYYEKGLETAREITDYSTIANLYDNISVLYNSMGQNDESMEYARRAIDYAEKGENTSDLIQAYFIYGQTMEHASRYDSATVYLRKAYQEVRNINSPRLIVKIVPSLIKTFEKCGQEDSVRYYSKICEQYIDKMTETNTEAIGYYEFKAEHLHMIEKNYEEALKLYRRIISLSDRNAPATMNNIYEKMADCYINTDRPQEAYRYMRMAYEIKDSLNNTNISEQLNEMKGKYEIQEKELEITQLKEAQLHERTENLQRMIWLAYTAGILIIILVILMYKNRLQKEKTQRLAQTIKQKEAEDELLMSRKYIEGMESERTRLAHELHDGVCNELLALEMEIKQNGKDNINTLIEKLGNTRNNIRDISHALMPPVFAYASIDEMLNDYITRLHLPETMHMTFHADRFDWETIPQNTCYEIYRIVQESVNNIIRHSECTEADITLRIKDRNMILEINDNGQYKTTRSGGIGARTVRDRVKSISGIMDFTTDEQGTHLIITIKI